MGGSTAYPPGRSKAERSKVEGGGERIDTQLMSLSLRVPTSGLSSKSPPSTRPGVARVAVIDPDPSVRALVAHWLKSPEYDVREYGRAGDLVQGERPRLDIACLDWDASEGAGALAALRSAAPNVPVVVMTSRRDPEIAVAAMRAGAYDCLLKPLDADRVIEALERARRRHELTRHVQQLDGEGAMRGLPGLLAGSSRAVRNLRGQVDRVIDRDVAVCLVGEAGAGEELVARTIHESSSRAGGPFLTMDCRTVDPSEHDGSLIGRVLEEGRVLRGIIEQANGGVLFLENVELLSLPAQLTLAQLLGSKQVRRPESRELTQVSVRLIVSAEKDLRPMVDNGTFREDLFFRLVVYPINVPSLRERAEDIPAIVGYLLRALAEQMGGGAPPGIDPEVLEALARYDWPGNLGELEHVVQRSMLSTSSECITLTDLPDEVRSSGRGARPANENGGRGIEPFGNEIVPLRDLEKRAIEHALRLTNGSVALAAKKLGIGRATLYRRIASLDLSLDVA